MRPSLPVVVVTRSCSLCTLPRLTSKLISKHLTHGSTHFSHVLSAFLNRPLGDLAFNGLHPFPSGPMQLHALGNNGPQFQFSM